MTIRHGLLWLHRWVGLTAGVVILVSAVTGGLMIWEHELDAALAGNWYINFAHSLHNGELFGLPTQITALLVCLALVAQITSGVVLWWKPRRNKRSPEKLAAD